MDGMSNCLSTSPYTRDKWHLPLGWNGVLVSVMEKRERNKYVLLLFFLLKKPHSGIWHYARLICSNSAIWAIMVLFWCCISWSLSIVIPLVNVWWQLGILFSKFGNWGTRMLNYVSKINTEGRAFLHLNLFAKTHVKRNIVNCLITIRYRKECFPFTKPIH